MNSTKIPTADKISFYVFFTTILLLPIFFLPKIPVSLDVSKAFIFDIGILISFIFWIIGRLVDGKVSIPKSFIFLSASLISLSALASTIFSKAKIVSFFGTGFEVGTFFSFLIMFLALYLASIFFINKERASYVYVGLFSSFFVASMIAIVGLFINIKNFFPSFFAGNSFGSLTDLAIFSGLICTLSLLSIEILKPKKFIKIILSVILLMSLFLIVLSNSVLVWLVLGFFSLMVFVYQMTTNSGGVLNKEVNHKKFPIISFLTILVCLSFSLSGGFFGSYLSKHFNISNTSIRPSFISTLDLGRHALYTSPVVGAGPNRFSEVWNLYKNPEINNSNFWNTQFNFGFGLLPTFAIEGGVLAILAWIFFLFVLTKDGIKNTIEHSTKDRLSFFLLASSFLGSIYLWIFNMIYSGNATLLYLAFVLTGFFVSVLIGRGVIKINEYSYLGDPRKSFFSILGLILVFILSITAVYSTSLKFLSYVDFGYVTATNSLSLDQKINHGVRAINFEKNDLGYRIMSNLMSQKLSNTVSDKNISPDELKKQVTNLFSSVESFAKSAVSYDSTNYLNWTNLGIVYEQFAPLGVDNATENAKNSFEKALLLSPSNPSIYLNYGLFFYTQKDYTNAVSKLEKAILLKRDYWDARYVLGLSYYYLNENSNAIDQFKILNQFFPQDQNIKNSLTNLEAGRAPENTLPSTIPLPTKKEIIPKK